MSRAQQFTRSLASGYLVIAANILFTLAQWPLAIRYLTTEEFGLWAAVAGLATSLQMLVDLGMSGAISRILIDHKDDKSAGGYGTVFKTGTLALVVQGAGIALLGVGVSFVLPGWMNIASHFHPVFTQLLAGHCVLLGAAFAGRIGTFALQAHQRFDVINYSTLTGFALNLLSLWLGFAYGLGLYSLLLAKTVELAWLTGISLVAAARLGFLPAAGQAGRADWRTFREIFSYANDIFLLSVGQVLILMSQTPLITVMLGLEANAVWSTMTKTFLLAQQLVARVFDFSATAFAEMMVRGERDRLRARFRDVVMLTGSLGAVLCLGVALGNASFVQLWMHGRFAWSVENDLLMALFILVGTSTRCHAGLAGLTKRIGAMKYVFLIEGALFVTLGSVLAPRLGLAGIIVSGIVSNLACSGLYALWRTREYFGVGGREVVFGWLGRPAILAGLLLAVAGGLWLLTHRLPALPQLVIDAAGFGVCAAVAGWRLGLSPQLRAEFMARFRRR